MKLIEGNLRQIGKFQKYSIEPDEFRNETIKDNLIIYLKGLDLGGEIVEAECQIIIDVMVKVKE